MYSIIHIIFKYMFTIPLLPLVVFIFGTGLIVNVIISLVTNDDIKDFKDDVVYGMFGWDTLVDVLEEMYGW